jgi:hypothetical protein
MPWLHYIIVLSCDELAAFSGREEEMAKASFGVRRFIAAFRNSGHKAAMNRRTPKTEKPPRRGVRVGVYLLVAD